jgi:hypothetical protein
MATATRSGYAPVGQTRFGGGLNLTDGADVVSPDQAVDLLNVVFLPQGGVRQRDGYQRFSASELTNRPDSLGAHYESDGTRQLLVGNGTRIDALNTSGTSIANVAPTASPQNFVRFAAPGTEHTLIANGTDTVRRWDGAAFSTPAYTGTTPTTRYLAVQSTDNRLVAARTAANPDRVLFSDPGVPTTFGVNNYVDLHPGSGEPITALVAWREYVFAFKETEYFVFQGTSTSSTGTPIFNVRPVSSMAGSVGAACAAPEGVYFLDRRGVYLTTGQAPQLVSGQLDPLFLGGASLYYQGGVIDTSLLTSARLWWAQGRLYLAFSTTSANNRLAVYSPRDGWWTLFDIPAAAITSFRPGTREEVVFAYASGLKHVARYYEGSGYLADDLTTTGTGGTAITSRWRQGWVDYGTQDQKSVRQTMLWGEGIAEFAISRDFELLPGRYDTATFGNASDTWGDGTGTDTWGGGTGPDTWGPAGTTAAWLISQSVSGHVLALHIQNSTLNRTWALHRLEHGFRNTRDSEVKGRFAK